MPLRSMASGVALAALAAAMSMPAFAQQSPEPGAAPAQPAQAQPQAELAPPPPNVPAPSVSSGPPPKSSAPHRRVGAGPVHVRASVNLRKGPGESYEILTLIPAGSALTVRSCSGEWCAVHWQGNEGYAIARNLDMGGRQAAGITGSVPPGYPPEGPPPPGYRYGPPVYAGPPGYYGYYGPPPPYYYYRPYWGWGWGWRRW